MRCLRIMCLWLAVLGAPAARGGGPAPDETAAAQPVAPAAFDGALLAREILRASNLVRLGHDARKLKTLRPLTAAADDQASLLALRLHVRSPDPRPAWEEPLARVRRRGLRPAGVGENTAALPVRDPATGLPRTYRQLAEAFVDAWLHSPAHRDNLLDLRFVHLGCAARLAVLPPDVPMVFAVQLFLVPE